MLFAERLAECGAGVAGQIVWAFCDTEHVFEAAVLDGVGFAVQLEGTTVQFGLGDALLLCQLLDFGFEGGIKAHGVHGSSVPQLVDLWYIVVERGGRQIEFADMFTW